MPKISKKEQLVRDYNINKELLKGTDKKVISKKYNISINTINRRSGKLRLTQLPDLDIKVNKNSDPKFIYMAYSELVEKCRIQNKKPISFLKFYNNIWQDIYNKL